jgi:hypothetical protein
MAFAFIVFRFCQIQLILISRCFFSGFIILFAFDFTKFILESYGILVQAYSEDVHAQIVIPDDLSIKTHCDMLDIAQSKKIFCLSFSLPEEPLSMIDGPLNELIFSIKNQITLSDGSQGL